MAAPSLTLTALPDIPFVEAGDDLGSFLIASMTRAGMTPREYDVLVVAQKIVSKAEGRTVDLAAVTPSERACDLAHAVDKDSRLVELILSESDEVVAHKPGVLVVAHKLGIVLANAGIDRSNVAGGERALLLPEDPDASAAELKARLEQLYAANKLVEAHRSEQRTRYDIEMIIELGYCIQHNLTGRNVMTFGKNR